MQQLDDSGMLAQSGAIDRFVLGQHQAVRCCAGSKCNVIHSFCLKVQATAMQISAAVISNISVPSIAVGHNEHYYSVFQLVAGWLWMASSPAILKCMQVPHDGCQAITSWRFSSARQISEETYPYIDVQVHSCTLYHCRQFYTFFIAAGQC